MASSVADIVPAGDAALQIRLPERLDPEVNAWCVACARALEQDLGTAQRDVVIGYCSVTVYFDPLRVDQSWVEDRMHAVAAAVCPEERVDGGVVEVPVSYGGEYGPDLADVAAFAGCSPAEVVARHASREYRVYLVGFVPGFAYMAEVDATIAAPRRSSPRTAVPAGSVAIAGGQTGIYPAVTPGGWNIIGRTPLAPYDPGRSEPFLFRPGDRVRFVPTAELYWGQTPVPTAELYWGQTPVAEPRSGPNRAGSDPGASG
jgi:KipI family sensor histidine kinase inhibitor